MRRGWEESGRGDLQHRSPGCRALHACCRALHTCCTMRAAPRRCHPTCKPTSKPTHLREAQVGQQGGLTLIAKRGAQPPHFRVKDGARLGGGPQLAVQLGALAQVRRHGGGWGRGGVEVGESP